MMGRPLQGDMWQADQRKRYPYYSSHRRRQAAAARMPATYLSQLAGIQQQRIKLTRLARH